MKKTLLPALALLLALRIAVSAFAAVEDAGFSDVDAGAWYAEAVQYCREHSLMFGASAATFAPDHSLTRAQLAAVLYRIAGSPAVTGQDAFADTPDGAWYGDAVLWASREGIMGGYGGGRFGPNDPVSREQMTAILWRYAGSPVPAGTAAFTDRASAASYAAAAVDWAGGNGIVRLVSGNRFAPKENATRAQVADALMHYDRSTPSAPSDAPSGGTRVLVAYFSRYGNTDYDSGVDATTSASVVVQDGQQQGTTERIARMIAEQTGGDLHRIETAEAYPTDFDDVAAQNHREMADGVRPVLSSSVDASGYDVLFVGYPVWASSAPAPALSFLESQDLSGKRVIPFCTHDGYGAGSSVSAIRRASPGAAVEQELTVDSSRVSSAQDAVAEWVSGLQLSAGPAPAQQGETAVRITVGDVQLEGVLYNSAMARQFIAQLPQTISMSNYGGREVYGGIAQAITPEGEGQLRFSDGDITYCPANNTAAIFYSQSSHPELTMRVYPIGRVTSELSLFPDLPSRVEITFAIVP